MKTKIERTIEQVVEHYWTVFEQDIVFNDHTYYVISVFNGNPPKCRIYRFTDKEEAWQQAKKELANAIKVYVAKRDHIMILDQTGKTVIKVTPRNRVVIN